MKLIRSGADRPYCLIASYAMCLECTIEELISEIGHDGLEIAEPTESTPRCFRAFHDQELLDCAIGRGWAVVYIVPQLVSNLFDGTTRQYEDTTERFWEYIANSTKAILLGKGMKSNTPHAVAWDGEHIYDPKGKVYELNDAPDNDFNELSGALLFYRIAQPE